MLLSIHRDHKDYLGWGAKDGHLDFHTVPELWIPNEWLSLFIVHLNSHQSDVQTVLFGCYMAGATWNCCCLSVVYTIQAHTSLQCHFMQSHIHRVHAYLAVTCHLHLWQNGWYLLHATAVTRGMGGGHWNKSRHRKLILEKKMLLPGPEPMTFDHKSDVLITELSLHPRYQAANHLSTCSLPESHR